MKKIHLSALVALAFTTLPFAVSAQSTPAPGSGSLDVWFKAPTAGKTVSGVLSMGANCYVNGTGVSRVQFFLDSTALNTDSTMSDGMQCALDTTKFANGTHQLKAVAYSSTGASRSDVISINIQNIASTPVVTPTNTAPTVAITAPTASQTVSGTFSYAANATDDAGVSRVDFTLDGAALLSDLSAPYGGSIDTTKLANGSHVLSARAYDAAGLSTATQVTFNVQNTTTSTTTPTSTTSTPAPGSGSLDVWFKAPTSGKTVSGNLNMGSNCYVAGTGVSRVQFFLDSTALNTDSTMSDGMQCALDTTKFANGTHQLKAVAYSSTGASRMDVISINIQNTTSGGSTTPTNTAPIVSLTAPAAGATISGAAVGCAASASDDKSVAKVEFYLGTTLLSTATTSPYTCAIDTTKVANGSYTLMARATDGEGASSTAQRSVTVSNTVTQPSTPPTGGTSAISTADILGQAQADVPFAQQAGYTGQVIGQFPDVKQIPESGINYNVLPNGETLRLGKQTDPTNGNRKALAFQLSPSDPMTSSSKRSEIEFPPQIALDKTYWIAYSAYIYDWGTLASGDESLFGTQVHSSASSLGLSPSFTVASFDGRTMRFSVQYNTSSSPTPSSTTSLKFPDWSQPGTPIPFGRWVDFVFKFRHSTGPGGLLQVWMDGSQVVNYSGPLGYNTPSYPLDYAKFGYYNWSSFNSSRKVLLRSPLVVSDPTGSKYQATDLRSYVQSH